MGHTKKILGASQIPSIPRFYSNKIAIEVAENIHLHYRNYRLEMDHNEFKILAESFIEAFGNWSVTGKPKKAMYEKLGDKNIFLAQREIPASPSLFNDNTNSGSLRVERQQWMDYFHIHYKDFRFEFSGSEFEEFAQVVSNALNEYRKNRVELEGPQRLGFCQRAVPIESPANKLTLDGNENKYWTKNEDMNFENIFASTYSAADSEKLFSRKSSIKNHIKIDVRDLYDSTLYHRTNSGKWGLDDFGIFLPLKNRYDFVKFFHKKEFSISKKEIESTNYFKLITQPLDSVLRDGQSNAVYAEPLKQVSQFMKLTHSIFDKGYLIFNKDNDLGKKFDAVEMRGSNKATFLRVDPHDESIITVVPDGPALVVQNGLHRLAILKYQFDIGELKNPLIEVKLNTGDINSLEMDIRNMSKKRGSKGFFIYGLFFPVIERLKTVLLTFLIFPYIASRYILRKVINFGIKIERLLRR